MVRGFGPFRIAVEPAVAVGRGAFSMTPLLSEAADLGGCCAARKLPENTSAYWLKRSQSDKGKVVSIKDFLDRSKRIEKDHSDLDALETPPLRNYDCKNYDTCLGLAAALDWESFSCDGCRGCVDKQLLWRAHHLLRSNDTMRRVCSLPLID